jgi:hypothetical protein
MLMTKNSYWATRLWMSGRVRGCNPVQETYLTRGDLRFCPSRPYC